jgi:1-deoxy-D-xylulose-5-phosphate synthase
VAIIGDGALTAGMAYEALNNAGASDCNLLVILNDNDMSISPPVGALNHYLHELMSGRFYADAKKIGKEVLKNAPPLYALAQMIEQQTQSFIQPQTMFENLGFEYTGPVDGHDVDAMVSTLKSLYNKPGPQFLHVVTRKGKGYAKAEADPVNYHGPGKFDPAVGIVSAASPVPAKPTFTNVFGQWLCDMAAQDERLVGITPAMREGSGMVNFSQQYPHRYHDVGIAEQHAVTFAAGMACEGLKPVVAIYSTFLQRAYDQLIHDVALQNLPVVFALDRAGLVGADGPTHAGMYDIAFTRCIPNMSVACPADEAECRQLLSTAYAQDHAVTVRYPRGAGVGTQVGTDLETLPFGKAEIRRQGQGVALLAFGPLLYEALKVAEGMNATVVNMRWAKPLDVETLKQIALSHDRLVTLEDATRKGGAGAAVLEALQDMGIAMPVLVVGFEDEFTEHGDPQKLMQHYGLTAPGIQKRIEDCWPDLKAAPFLRVVG